MQILFDREQAGTRRDIPFFEGTKIGYVLAVDHKQEILILYHRGERVATFPKEPIK